MSANLRLLPALPPMDPAAEPEQLTLRPVFLFVVPARDIAMQPPGPRRQRPPRREHPKPFYAATTETYRAPVRVRPRLPVIPNGTHKSFGPRLMTQAEYDDLIKLEMELLGQGLLKAPDTYADCEALMATDDPCPWTRCRHHLAIEIRRRGATEVVALNHPDKSIDELEETCSKRYARNHPDGSLLEHVGEALGLTLEGTRLLEISGMRKLATTALGREWLAGLRDRERGNRRSREI